MFKFLTIFILFSLSSAHSQDFSYFDSRAKNAAQQVLPSVDTGMGKKTSLTLFPSTLGEMDGRSKRGSFSLKEYLAEHFRIGISRLRELYECSVCEIEDFHVIANFVHGKTSNGQNQYWLAVFPKASSRFDVKHERVIPQIQWFENGAGAHAQLRIALSFTIEGKTHEKILLIPQVSRQNETWGQDVRDLSEAMGASPEIIAPAQRCYLNNQAVWIRSDIVFSLYALRPVGESDWDAIDGILGRYSNALGFYSTLDRAVDQTNETWVEQFEGNLESTSVRALLDRTVELASRSIKKQGNGDFLYPQIYNTVFNSCVSVLLRSLWYPHQFSDRPRREKGLHRADRNLFNPYRLAEHLQTDIGMQPIESFNEEFGGSVRSPVPDDGELRKVYDRVQVNLSFLRSDLFDRLVRRVTFYAVKERWTREEFLGVAEALKLFSSENQPSTIPERAKAASEVSTIRGFHALLMDVIKIAREEEDTVSEAIQSQHWTDLFSLIQTARE